MGLKLTTELPYLDELLRQSESADPDTAINAFNNLCGLGCERRTLGELLAWYSYSAVTLTSGRKINVHSLDSWKTALDAQDGKAPITREHLDQISERAKALLSDIKRLIRTPIVRQLVEQGEILSEDLLGGGVSAKTGVFQGLIRLPKLVKRFGPRKQPDRTKALVKICLYIESATGGYRDALLTDLLNALTPHDSDNPTTATAIKQWRKRQGIITKRGTRTA